MLFALSTALGAACHGAGSGAAIERPTQAVARPSATMPAPSLPPGQHSAAFVKLRDMDEATACALPLAESALKARAGAKPFSIIEPPSCGYFHDPLCDAVDVAPQGADACYVSNDHIRALEPGALNVAPGAVGKSDPWNGTQRPKYLDRIEAHLHLDPSEKALLRKNGFVVLDRLPYLDYAGAFHDVFQEELPLWVGVDSILHAAYVATDAVLGTAERSRLAPALQKMLEKLQKTLAASKGIYDETTRKDLDLYLAVPAQLNKENEFEHETTSLFGQDKAVSAVVGAIQSEEKQLQPIEIFGRRRMVDFSQYTPRGHYAVGDPGWWNPGPYFKAMTWLTQLEWNLVSRGSRSSHPEASPDPRETPREIRDALALADLFRRSGALTELAQFEEVYSAFGGHREDVGIPELLSLMDKNGFTATTPDAPEKLKRAIGDGYRRTARVHFMPQGVRDLPVITTLFGSRITPDIAPLGRLVHDATPGRFDLGAADVGYVLGHDRAASYLKKDLENHSRLKGELDAARAEMKARTNQSLDVAGSFLGAVLSLAEKPRGLFPSFMQREAFADMRMSSALVGYAQLRHTFILLQGQGYDAYGCAIPDAYVEPAAPFYDALIAHTERLRKVAGGGFEGLLRVLRVLSAISKTEASRGAPTPTQAQWLGMVSEYIPEGGYSDSGDPPKWTGWYFDMFEDREDGAMRPASLVADYFTLTNAGKVAHLGVDGLRLGVFIVDTGGEPRAMVGPVARGYEAKTPIAERLDDQAAQNYLDKHDPFRESFAAKPWSDPKLGLGGQLFHCIKDGKLEARLVLAADRPLGPITVTLLDHHADPLGPALTKSVDDDVVVFPFLFPEIPWVDEDLTARDMYYGKKPKNRTPVEALSLRVEDLGRSGLGKGSYDWFTSPTVFYHSSDTPDMRPQLVQRFVLGGDWDYPQPAEQPPPGD
ncbi:DUF3160 domain-containing protein [Polyangium sp. 6x1]|uniref:DUF3160 domain-containing protein n=1 Tax=Polyangium sp. 6x1 TaxID=3042689 RepID=UPI0024825805|nr:DUF3160 domain-containing protein [Polyangium sp. 6x1]MDI1445625.1 DUF3160 domain-containing protein [Polyangium sp. 6x1]